ncbi:MAG: (Fe-S)-binding protein [Acidimicrobiales bacterium]
MDLNIDPDELAACVSCGLCLPHCPTYRVTGDDMASPRGRISLMRAVQDDDAPLLDEVVQSMETCVQCRGCEPACPSGVPFGHLMEATRSTLADRHVITPRWQRLGMKVLGWPRTLRAGSSALALAQRVRLVPSRRLGLPDRLPVRRRPLVESGRDVWLFTGCVMDAWQRDVHQATQRVIEAAGFGVAISGDSAPCCGALHTHAGLTGDAQRLARRTMAALGGDDRPIVVNSAGCGAALKDCGHLLDTDEARRFSARVVDVHEFMADHLDRLPDAAPLSLTVAVQDPCHLRHVQRAHEPVRALLARFVTEVRELDDDGLCCGAGGAFSLLEPEMAADIRSRKQAAIDRVGPDVVASANPGCALHLAATGLDVRHPMELVADAIGR